MIRTCIFNSKEAHPALLWLTCTSILRLVEGEILIYTRSFLALSTLWLGVQVGSESVATTFALNQYGTVVAETFGIIAYFHAVAGKLV